MPSQDRIVAVVLIVAGALVSSGCSGEKEPAEEVRKIVRATAYLEARGGSQLTGTAIFLNEPGRVSLQIDVENAPPGMHAVHIHEFGDCSAPDASSAGGHWNPTGHDHGKWDAEPFHLGDIGNLEVADDGTGSLTMSTDHWTLGGGADNDVLGKAVIVHEAADDFTTQPTGAAGGRIGCGVIEG